MRPALLLALVGLLVGCGTDSGRVVDGGVLDDEGWPRRQATERFRCPKGTFLVDEQVGEGRRRVTCRTMLNPSARGFELAWHANGRLATKTKLDEFGRPLLVVQFDEEGRRRLVEDWSDGVRRESRAFYPNGQRRKVEAYDPQTEVNTMSVWAADGSVEAQGDLVKGKREGKWVEWVDGATETATYDSGVRAGKVTRNYPDGSVERGRYEGGRRSGLWRRNDRNGLPMKEARYRNGELHGEWKSWHPNQQPKAEGTYLNGVRHGLWTTWHPSGEVATRQTFRCGERHGLYRSRHANGQPSEEGVFWNDARIGEWRRWSPAGDLFDVDNYPVPEEVEDLAGLRSGSTTPGLPKTCDGEPSEPD